MKSAEKSVTFLGKETKFEGKLGFEGLIRIDGYVKGKIEAKGNLIIGDEALIEADIHVSYASISGEVHGNITADQRVDIHAPAKVFGNIYAPAVVIEEGVIFEGHTKMYRAIDRANGLVEAEEYQGIPPPNITAIYGIVVDQNTGKPIKNARVICKGDGKFKTETNASGYYELINLKEGKWKLRVDAGGYRKEKSDVVISGEGTYEKRFELKLK
ncbi:MAG: polymer-forming cytoskeletal protein [Deltaproteobacteria bacterium]|nr:polymer-forming cytoskeletal protein [Deltaproteobacteria bacterium]